MKFEQRTFTGGRVDVDNNEFVTCQFNGTMLVYKGLGTLYAKECQFNNVTWKFEGPASYTIAFLRAMYHELGESGRRLVERTFDEIMQPSPPPRPGSEGKPSPEQD